jgi:hypothetical protein
VIIFFLFTVELGPILVFGNCYKSLFCQNIISSAEKNLHLMILVPSLSIFISHKILLILILFLEYYRELIVLLKLSIYHLFFPNIYTKYFNLLSSCIY